MDLIEKYGYCILHTDSDLFHSGEISDDSDSIFFDFHPGIARAFSNSCNKIEIWRIKKDIKLLFMIKEVDCRSWTRSAITEIYQFFFPDDTLCNDLDIKYRDKLRCIKLIEILKKQGIMGWFSSLEDNFELEVCLFRDAFLPDYIGIKKKAKIESSYALDFENALKDAYISPCKEFYELSTLKLQNCPFINYKKFIDECIEEECCLGFSKKHSENSNLTLRIKLKI